MTEVLWSKQPILSVQASRGIAAILVVAHHTGWILDQPRYGAIHAFDALTSRGWIGVNFFFVLSGFIIMLAHYRDIGHPMRLRVYAGRRLLRVYPTYLIFLIVFIVAASLGVGPRNFTVDVPNIATAFTLVRWEAHPTLPLQVAWTLIFEVGFYVAFAMLIANRTLGAWTFIIWLAFILVDSFLFRGHDLDWKSIWNINFYIGGAAYVVYRTISPKWGLPLLAIGLISLMWVLASGRVSENISEQQAAPFNMLLLGLPFGLIVLGCGLTEHQYQLKMPDWLLICGDASFSIYLLHSAVISMFGQMHRFFSSLPPSLVFFIAFFCAVLSGILGHFFVERPLIRYLRSLTVFASG